MKKVPNNLVTFLYILMRDSLPCGEVARIKEEVLKVQDKDKQFSNIDLQRYAEKIAVKLTAK